MTGLRLYLLGPFRVIVDGVEIDPARLPRKTVRLLVKLLALAPGRKMHRAQLIEALSPDVDEETGLNRLHKAIHLARRALEPELEKVSQSRFILTQETQVLLAASGVVTDVDEFEEGAAQALRTRDNAQIERSLALHKGDLLEEDLYEEWAAAPRERLRLTYQRLLEALSASYEVSGDFRTLEATQRLLSAFPADEEGHRRLMRFYAASGQRHLALEQYRQCSEALKLSLDAAPEGATVELYEKILSGKYPTTGTPQAAIKSRTGTPKVETPMAPEKPGVRFPRLLAGFAAGLVLAACIMIWVMRSREPAQPISLAILPLHAKQPGPESDLISDGLTEGLITSASRFPGVRVMARTTAYAYQGRTDGWQVGRELKVRYVLSGTVQEQDDKVNVNVELVDVADGARTWGQGYSVARRDAPAIQQLISAELANALKVRASDVHPEQSTSDAEAYRLYLTGRQLWNQRTASGLRKSIEAYKQAIARDPKYALAYAGLADSYGLIGFSDGPPREYYPQAREAATKALALDPNLAEAETSLAMVNELYDWNWPSAEALFRRAIDMNPGYVTAHHWLGVHLAAQGRYSEATAELSKAMSLDPRSAIVVLNSGYPALYQRKYSDALVVFRRALELAPDFPPAYEDLVTVFERQEKRKEEALAWVGWLRGTGRTELAKRLQKAAEDGDAQTVFNESMHEVETAPAGEYLSPILPAVTAMRLGDREAAFRWLERGFEERCPELIYLAADPKYDPIRKDPRFASLLSRIGLTAQ